MQALVMQAIDTLLPSKVQNCYTNADHKRMFKEALCQQMAGVVYVPPQPKEYKMNYDEHPFLLAFCIILAPLIYYLFCPIFNKKAVGCRVWGFFWLRLAMLLAGYVILRECFTRACNWYLKYRVRQLIFTI